MNDLINWYVDFVSLLVVHIPDEDLGCELIDLSYHVVDESTNAVKVYKLLNSRFYMLSELSSSYEWLIKQPSLERHVYKPFITDPCELFLEILRLNDLLLKDGVVTESPLLTPKVVFKRFYDWVVV